MMFSMWEQFEGYDDFKQCLFIPCDSHGISAPYQRYFASTILFQCLATVSTRCQIISKGPPVACSPLGYTNLLLQSSAKLYLVSNHVLGHSVSSRRVCSQKQRCTEMV